MVSGGAKLASCVAMCSGRGRSNDCPLHAARSVAIVLLVAVYVVFVGTARGREIDSVLAHSDLELGGRWEVLATLVSSLLSPVSICVAVVGLLWLARRLHRQSDGVRAAVIVAIAAFGARALKAVLGALDPVGGEAARELGPAFYPSGHATVAMALCLGAMVVARDHRRALIVAGAVWCAVHGFVIFATRSHHVSDVLGGFLLGVVLASTMGLRAGSDALTRPRIDWTAVLAILTAAIATALLMELARRMAASFAQPRAVLMVTAAGLSAAALLLVAGFGRLLGVAARR